MKNSLVAFLLMAGVAALATLPAPVATADVPLVAAALDAPDVDGKPGCLLIPECGRNSDCDAVCGAGQGRCVRNDCPIRVCRCR
jgi:hypothetical protein